MHLKDFNNSKVWTQRPRYTETLQVFGLPQTRSNSSFLISQGPPMPHPDFFPPPPETAWERGLRHAKEVNFSRTFWPKIKRTLEKKRTEFEINPS